MTHASEVEREVRDAGFFDLGLSNGIAVIANPNSFVGLRKDRDPIRALVPSVTAIMLDVDGNVSHGTATFGMDGDAVDALTEMGEEFVSFAGSNVSAAKSDRILGSRMYKNILYTGARRNYSCTIGGVAIIRVVEGDTGIESVPFITSALLETVDQSSDTTFGKTAMAAGRGLAKLMGKDTIDAEMVGINQSAKILYALAEQSRPRHDGQPVVVGRGLIATV